MGMILQQELEGLKRLKTFEFWRNQAVAFCVFSLVGHWLEIPYCLFNDFFFHIVDPDSGVFTDPLQPFFVYGFSAVFCGIVMVPIRNIIQRTHKERPWTGLLAFFIIGVIVAMDLELLQGFLQNMPDENGTYPLWDNSQLPLNVAGQAWLVNDFFLSAVLTLYVWAIEPFMARLMNLRPQWRVNLESAAIIIAFTILSLVKYVWFPVV